MFSRIRVAIRFFFVGLAVGVLLAPRSGIETRRLLRERADRLLNDLMDAATFKTDGASPTAARPAARRAKPAVEPDAEPAAVPGGGD
jgi:predicted lipid-binding transport protein (Tim44 family)